LTARPKQIFGVQRLKEKWKMFNQHLSAGMEPHWKMLKVWKSVGWLSTDQVSMVFDIKMDNLTGKARLVAGGHTTETPVNTTYSSVVLHESVRIAFLLAALNDLQVCAANIGNAYLNANCHEKIWTIAGPEFGSKKGSVMIIRKHFMG
jgi:hypothetical protein